MNQSETIKQMQKRHKNEIQELQDNCKHEIISKCMPFMWAVGHMSHCVKICKNCGKELFTTMQQEISKVFYKGDNPADFPIEYIKPDNWFECPHREDCRYWYRKKNR